MRLKHLLLFLLVVSIALPVASAQIATSITNSPELPVTIGDYYQIEAEITNTPTPDFTYVVAACPANDESCIGEWVTEAIVMQGTSHQWNGDISKYVANMNPVLVTMGYHDGTNYLGTGELPAHLIFDISSSQIPAEGSYNIYVYGLDTSGPADTVLVFDSVSVDFVEPEPVPEPGCGSTDACYDISGPPVLIEGAFTDTMACYLDDECTVEIPDSALTCQEDEEDEYGCQTFCGDINAYVDVASETCYMGDNPYCQTEFICGGEPAATCIEDIDCGVPTVAYCNADGNCVDDTRTQVPATNIDYFVPNDFGLWYNQDLVTNNFVGYDVYLGDLAGTERYFIIHTDSVPGESTIDLSSATFTKTGTAGNYKFFIDANLGSATKTVLIPYTGNPDAVYFCCPDALSIEEVGPACSNVFEPTKNINGEFVIISTDLGEQYVGCEGMTNSGAGGLDGSGVPEFSDLGWILACVLGAGGFFIASRKIRKF